MTKAEKLKTSDELQNKLCDAVYTFEIYRKVTTKAGYETRKKLINQMKELLNEIEDLNEELKKKYLSNWSMYCLLIFFTLIIALTFNLKLDCDYYFV